MAQYAILIHEDVTPYADFSPEQWQEVYDSHGRFAGQVGENGGKLLDGKALQPALTATSIRDGVVTDGPFVDNAEQFCGYYLIEAADLDHALDLARLCPARFGGVEVRPVMQTPSG